MVLHDPLDWALEAQVVVDVLRGGDSSRTIFTRDLTSVCLWIPVGVECSTDLSGVRGSRSHAAVLTFVTLAGTCCTSFMIEA